MWLPFGLHKIEKPGQGMRARIFAFCCLMALLGWGAWSTYHMLFVSFNWREELPDPSFDYSKPHPCPVPNTLRQYVIETTNFQLVVFRPKPAAPEPETAAGPEGTEGPEGTGTGENGETKPPAAGADPTAAPPAGTPRFQHGIPADGVRISVNDPGLIAKVAEELRKNPAVAQLLGANPPAQDDQLIPAVQAKDWKLVAAAINTVQMAAGVYDGAYIRSGAGTGISISVTNPIDGGAMSIDYPQPYIVPANLGTCPETLRQLNGVGIPWAIVIAVLVLLVSLWISWKVAFGRWMSTMLIETDQEMNKVAWPTRERVFNSSVVVVFCTLFFAVLLFASDLLLNNFIKFLGLW